MKSYYQILYLLTVFSLIPSGLTFAQNAKDEVEKSIERKEMPTTALSILNQFWNEEKKVDFYRQLNGDKISFEAKLNWEDHQYSIEFDSAGLLIDVEQLIRFEELPEALRNTITEEINKQYTRFKFTRIQRQFSASEKDENGAVLENVFDNNFIGLAVRYEVEVNAQNKNELGSFELLFDENGKFIQKRKIVRRSLDNIW